MRTRAPFWLGVLALVVLAGRAVAYALSPSPLAAELSGRAGGPALPVVAVVSLVLAVGVSAAVLWLAALGVRERRLLEPHAVVALERVRLVRLVARSAALFAGALLVFGLLESYIHWRAGLGWHGLHCLTGPVHADAVPLLGGFSLVAAALVAAADHVVAWMRRTLAELRRTPRLPELALMVPPLGAADRATPAFAGASGARAPPRLG
ncbi:MAG TPA: hypothetical protein VNT04_03875 [Gaiellaceae bacterium]|nr:hypothetical protein [Gaiellaceae bacterium]